MAFWKPSLNDLLKSGLQRLDARFNAIRGGIKSRTGRLAPPKIMPYRGYGNAEQFHLLGRVLEDRRLGSPKEDDTGWDNLWAMYRRFAVYSFAGVRVRAEFDGQTWTATTDEQGRFAFHWKPPAALDRHKLWHEVRLTVLDEEVENHERSRATGIVLTPPEDCRFGVISDVDDTVLYSDATDAVQMVRIACMHNARTRTPLPGVAEFYRALEQGGGGSPNPFFYVSSSAWNLYDMLADFFDLNDLPRGPIFLRNLGSGSQHQVKSGHKHKLDRIREIMGAYPRLPFLLIGDAGQEDPTLYRQAVLDFPGRVKAIYIRAVRNRAHDEKVRRVTAELLELGTPIILVEDTHAAVAHAVSLGLIDPQAVSERFERMDLSVEP
jgi:phosphatidate phosphatase APP1